MHDDVEVAAGLVLVAWQESSRSLRVAIEGSRSKQGRFCFAGNVCILSGKKVLCVCERAGARGTVRDGPFDFELSVCLSRTAAGSGLGLRNPRVIC